MYGGSEITGSVQRTDQLLVPNDPSAGQNRQNKSDNGNPQITDRLKSLKSEAVWIR